MADEPNTVAAGTGLTDNIAGALAYLTVIPAIIFLIVEPYNKNSFVRFNSWQCIFLFCVAVAVNFALGLLIGIFTVMSPFMRVDIMLSRLLELFWIAVLVFCAYNAYQGKRYKLPIIGAIAERQAGA